MSSIVLCKSDAYINIGAARGWREHLLNHTFSAWIKTSCQQPACLVSLTNETREVFSVDVNISPHPSRDGTLIAHKYQNIPPTRFINSPGARWQRAPVPKTLKPVKLAGTHGAILGNLAGGVRVAVEDDHGHRVVAETPLPILADDSWHFLQVTVEGNEVVISVDGNHLSVFYVKRDPKLEPLDWNNVGDRVVYPSHDLLAARFSLKPGHGVQDHYCGMLADVAVEIGHPGGHKLHWWVTDNTQGTIVWDRGSGAAQHPQGIHLNLCACGWDTEDFPATSLLLNGYEGRTAEVPELDETMLESLATVDRGDPRVESPPHRMVSPDNANNDLASLQTSDNQVPSESPTGSPFSQNDVVSPVSGESSDGSKPALALVTHSDEPQAPISQTMNREYFERVQKEEGRQSMSFSMWICTHDRDPAIVFTAPFRNPVHLILNLDCKPSVALVNGVDAFVSQCDVTDGKWHHIRWIIDPKTGASLFMDNALAAWQYVALHVDEDGSGPLRGRSASVDGSSGGSPIGTVPSFGGMRSRTRFQASPAKSETKAEFHEALQRRSITTSMLNLHSYRKSLGGPAEELDGAPDKEVAASTSWRRARSRNSITFMDASINSFVAQDIERNRERSVAVAASTAFAADEEELLGDLLQELEDADEKVAAGHAIVGKVADQEQRDSTAVSPTVSNHFLFLSIKKRREIIQVLSDMMQQRKKNADNTTKEKTLKCFTLGSYFMGEIREVLVKIGNHSLTWRYDAGAGRSVTPTVNIKDTEDAERSMMSLLTPQNDFGAFGAYRSSGHRFHGLVGTMKLSGRMTLFPKTILPYSCPMLDDKTTLALGGVRVPLDRSSTGIDAGFFVKLKRGASYGHVVTVESVCLVELQQNRLNVFVVGTVDASLRASTLLKVPDMLSKFVDDAEKPRLINCHCDTTVFEDLQWHHVRVSIPTVGDYHRVGITVDEIPMELTTSLVTEQFPNGGLAGSRCNSRQLSLSSRRGTVLLRPSLCAPDHVGEDVLEISGMPLATPKSNATTPQAMQRRRTTTEVKESSAKVRLVLYGLSSPVLPATPQAAHDVQLARVTCGGCGFGGSVVQLHVVLNGQEYLWPLRDSCRASIARCPPVVRAAFLNHTNMQPPHPSIPLTPSHMECDGDASVHTHWQPTALPSKALHFDGHSSFVSSVNLRSNFHMSNLKRFAVSLWIKAGASSDPTVSIDSGCLFTIHDIQRPTTESSCGIFTHTRVDAHTSPRKRSFAPYITTFLLVDSCARALCLETEYDLYDGLWHKLQWVVYDAPLNESHVFIDDVAVPARLVCSDHPREFTCRKPVLNLGARNEGDNDVTNYFVGEIRNFKLAREVGDDILSWQMTEGEGDVLNDEFQRITGCVWAPEWIFTPFPPMTPIIREESVVEVSPVTDLEASARVAPMWFSFSLKSNSNAIGSVWNIVSADRCVLGSFVANEGGDHERRFNEPGTHTLRLQRVVRKAMRVASSSSLERPGDDQLGHLSSSILSPMAKRGTLPAALSSDTSIGGEVDSMACSGMASSSVLRTAHQRHRKIARRAELKELLKAQKSGGGRDSATNETSFLEASCLSDSTNAAQAPSTAKHRGCSFIPTRASSATAVRFAMVLEERVYQYHHKDLCDGKWHKITLYLPPNPTVEHAKVYMDELDMEAMHLSTTDLRELPDTILDDLANMPSTNASSVQDRTPLEILRDQISWGSVVLGKSSVTGVPALHCCVRNFAVLTDQCRNELLFVPFASTMDMVSPVPRDVAATGVQWELSVPPKSSIALGNDSYILVPPLANIDLRSFEIHFRLRAVTTEASCILEFGSVTNGYLCIMLNQDAFGEDAENSIRVCLCDSEGRDLHASCFLSEDDYEPSLVKRKRPIDDDQWHTVVLRVVDAACNNVLFEIDGVKPQMRYANCGSPCNFKPLTEGGTIGALLDVLDPKLTLAGSVKNFTISTITNGPAVAQDPELPMEKELLALYEATSGFASILTDRSGNRNHAMAVNPVWKTDLQATWTPLEVPSKAADVFSSCHLTVSRWSNNPSDGVEKSTHSDEVVMDEFPEDGWASGSKGPQWISIDLGSAHTVFGIEIDVFRASSSKHEVYVSRSNLSKSSTFNGLVDPKWEAVPQATLLETIQLRPASPKTMRVKIGHPLFGVRWLRIVAVESTVPVAYSGIRIVAIRGDYCATRKRSMSEVLGRTLSTLNAKSQAGPMLSMFPDTLVSAEGGANGGASGGRHPLHSRGHRNTILWGGEDSDQPDSSPFVIGDHRRVKKGGGVVVHAARAARERSLGASPSISPRDLGTGHVTSLKRKTTEEQERELRLIFYTQDVERTGYISLSAFMEVFHKVDITGLLSDEQVLSFLRDAGVVEPRVDFEQFVKVIAHIETW